MKLSTVLALLACAPEPVRTNILLHDTTGDGIYMDYGTWSIVNRHWTAARCTYQRLDACGEFGFTAQARAETALPTGYLLNVVCRLPLVSFNPSSRGRWDYEHQSCYGEKR